MNANATQQDNKMLDKIKKILNKAQSAEEVGSVHEAEIMFAKIDAILIKHGLTMFDVEKHNLKESGDNVITETGKENGITFGEYKCYGRWDRQLLLAVCDHFMCHMIFWRHGKLITNKKGRTSTMGVASVIGTPQNIEATKFVYDYTKDLVFNWAKKAYRAEIDRLKDAYGLDTLSQAEFFAKEGLMPYRETWIKSYLMGAVNSLARKMYDIRRASEANDEQVHGLVLVHKRKIDDFIAKNHADARTSTTKSFRAHAGAYKKGHADAQSINISAGLENSNHKQLK